MYHVNKTLIRQTRHFLNKGSNQKMLKPSKYNVKQKTNAKKSIQKDRDYKLYCLQYYNNDEDHEINDFYAWENYILNLQNENKYKLRN